MEVRKLEQTGKDMWQELIKRIQCCYKNEVGWKHAESCLRGLPGTAERKSGWPIAEYLGENTPYALQQFIYRGAWSADKLRDILQDYVVEHLGEKAGIVVLDETCVGEKGERWYDWIQLPVNQTSRKSLGKRSLLFRRNINDHKDIQAYVCYAAYNTPLQELVYIAGRRWTVEMYFEQAKGEVGLDQYEFRGYEEWNKHITLSCLAHAYPAAMKDRLNSVDFLKITHFHKNDSIPKSMAAFKASRGLSV
jgi:SRSO17 transposase